MIFTAKRGQDNPRRRSVIKAMSLGAIGAAAAGPLARILLPRPARAADIAKIRTCTQLFAGRTSNGPGTKAVGEPACLWKADAISVRFLEGDPFVQGKVRAIAMEWTQYTGIPFVFGEIADADIRIAFQPTGSWSYVGTCQYDLTPAQATMNFGWLDPSTADEEYRRVVLHEFGHAVGLVHEHQNPEGHIHWNLDAVYDYYKRTQGWDRQKTYANVIQKYDAQETNHTRYDPNSIMEYPIPKELTTDGFEVGWNRELSDIDKKFVRRIYGRS